MLIVECEIGTEKGDTWKEDLKVKSLETAEKEILELVDWFNKDVTEPLKKRKLIRIIGNPKLAHDWHKVNTFTLESSDGALYDLYECSNCNLQKRRYGVAWSDGGECHPELVCKPCHKEFLTVKLLRKHQRRRKHF